MPVPFIFEIELGQTSSVLSGVFEVGFAGVGLSPEALVRREVVVLPDCSWILALPAPLALSGSLAGSSPSPHPPIPAASTTAAAIEVSRLSGIPVLSFVFRFPCCLCPLRSAPLDQYEYEDETNGAK